MNIFFNPTNFQRKHELTMNKGEKQRIEINGTVFQRIFIFSQNPKGHHVTNNKEQPVSHARNYLWHEALWAMLCYRWHVRTHTHFSNRQTKSLLCLLIEAVQDTTKAWHYRSQLWNTGNQRPIIHPLLFGTKLSLQTMLLIRYSGLCTVCNEDNMYLHFNGIFFLYR